MPASPTLRAAALSASLLASAPALAAPPSPSLADSSQLFGPVIGRPTELSVETERLSFVFNDPAKNLVSFEARYTLVNTTSEHQELAIAFYRWDVDAFRVTLDGAAPTGEPTDDELKDLELSLSAPAASLLGVLRRAWVSLGATGPHPERVAFRIVAEPGQRHEIVVSGRARALKQHDDRGLLSIEAVVARHLLLGTRPPDVDQYVFVYDLAPSARWKGTPRVDVSITYPSQWRRPRAGDDKAWSARREGATIVLTRSMDRGEASDLRIEVDTGDSGFRNGGPLIGIGGTIGPTRAVRGRLGYEVAGPEWLLYSLTVDTDFRRRAIVTLLIEAASPAVLIVPSAGFGVGVPIQIVPDARPGVRLQGDLHFYPIGFVTSVDVYPRLGALPTLAEVSLLAQAAF
jgi:hypothetical protein